MTFHRVEIISTLDYLDAALACLPAEDERSSRENRVAWNVQLAKARIMNACVVDTDVEPGEEGGGGVA